MRLFTIKSTIMSQPCITSFFNSRKRAATDDVFAAKNKIQVLEQPQVTPRSGGTLKHVKLLSNKKEASGVGETNTPRVKRPRAVAKLSFDEINKEIYQEANGTPSSSPMDTEAPTLPKHHNAVSFSQVTAVDKSVPIKAFMKKQSAVNVARNLNETKADSVSAFRKELNLGDLKRKLVGSSRLAELKASAERLSRNYQLLKEKGNLKEFKSIDVEVPTSPSKGAKLRDALLSPKKMSGEPEPISALEKPLMSPRKVVVSPVKSPSKVPAYIKHASLATSTTSLPLPHHYRSLAEIFRGMETVASLLYNRKEKITFGKLRPSVQEMLKKNFTEKHLEQIKYIAPEFYSFDLEKMKSFSTSAQKQAYELLVTPVLPSGVNQMSPTLLLERRRRFFEKLTALVKQHHSKFLLGLDPPMIIPDQKLARWHPEFQLEKIPEVDCSKLPQVPGKETYSTAEDVLAKAREMFSCNTRMERALEKLAQAKARGLTEKEKIAIGLTGPPTKSAECQTTAVPATSNITILNPALRNLPASLLEKVKAKQAAKALEAMTRSSEDERKCLIYSRLPDLARTLRNIFVTERKNVLALNVILSKLDSSFQARVSAPDLKGDIELLTKELPEWVSLQVVRSVTYLKLDRAGDLQNIKEKLQALADKYQN